MNFQDRLSSSPMLSGLRSSSAGGADCARSVLVLVGSAIVATFHPSRTSAGRGAGAQRTYAGPLGSARGRLLLHGVLGLLGVVLDVLGGSRPFLLDGVHRIGRGGLHGLHGLLRGFLEVFRDLLGAVLNLFDKRLSLFLDRRGGLGLGPRGGEQRREQQPGAEGDQSGGHRAALGAPGHLAGRVRHRIADTGHGIAGTGFRGIGRSQHVVLDRNGCPFELLTLPLGDLTGADLLPQFVDIVAQTRPGRRDLSPDDVRIVAHWFSSSLPLTAFGIFLTVSVVRSKPRMAANSLRPTSANTAPMTAHTAATISADQP